MIIAAAWSEGRTSSAWRRRSTRGTLLGMETAAKLLEEAMRLPEDEREELAAKLLDSLEPPPGISIDDKDEIEKRAAEARSGAPGISWDEIKRDLLK
jgi:putative addiction module component (TIGR02574 family)